MLRAFLPHCKALLHPGDTEIPQMGALSISEPLSNTLCSIQGAADSILGAFGEDSACA